MLIYHRTSILESSAQTLVNTVNCVGVMGKGIAREFKEREPQMFESYKRICEADLLKPGKLWLWQGSEQWVLNFPTKVNWRNPSRLEWIEAGLQKFVRSYEEKGIREISFPRLGCGNGGLDWDDVKPVMERHLQSLDIPVYIHDFTVEIGLPEHLEAISQQLKRELNEDSSFDGFTKLLERLTALASNEFQDLENGAPFRAEMDPDGLHIRLSDTSWFMDLEALRGVWLSLLGGLLTKEKAGWSAWASGEALVSMLSVLPQVRPVQIQRSESTQAEIAVELRPEERRSTSAPMGRVL